MNPYQKISLVFDDITPYAVLKPLDRQASPSHKFLLVGLTAAFFIFVANCFRLSDYSSENLLFAILIFLAWALLLKHMRTSLAKKNFPEHLPIIQKHSDRAQGLRFLAFSQTIKPLDTSLLQSALNQAEKELSHPIDRNEWEVIIRRATVTVMATLFLTVLGILKSEEQITFLIFSLGCLLIASACTSVLTKEKQKNQELAQFLRREIDTRQSPNLM